MEDRIEDKLFPQRGETKQCWGCGAFHWGTGLPSCDLGHTPDQARRPADCLKKPQCSNEMILIR